MAQLSAKARANMPASAFAYIDPDGRRLLPIHDEAHVRNALARFNRVAFDDDASRDRARTKLLKAAKRYGIMPVGFIDGQLRPEQRLPTGRVSLLLADIENSTGHLTDLGDRYPRLLTDVRRLLRRAIRQSGGHEVDARAEEFFAAFPHAARALETAIAVQRSIASHAWVDDRAVLVRIGLHVGRPTLTASGYVGIAVNTVSRLSAMGNGGQVIASSSFREVAGEADGIGWHSLGRYRLRGIPDEHELFQVEAPGLEVRFPPLRVAEGRSLAGDAGTPSRWVAPHRP